MKVLKKLFLMMLLVLGIGSLNSNVYASSAPNTITLKSKSSMYYFSEAKGTDYINGYNFYRKELKDGTLAYCASNIDKDVPGGRTLELKGVNTDMGLDYIVKNGYPNKSFTGNKYKDYYITQAAIWRYFDEVYGSSNWKSSTFTSESTGMKGYVYTLVQGAKLARNTSYETPSISISTDNKTMNLSVEGTYFVSNVITVNSKNITGNYKVNLKNAPAGTILRNSKGLEKTEFSKDESFIVYVPVKSLTSQIGEITLSVSAKGVTYKTYIYTSNISSKQDIVPVTVYEEETTALSSEITLNYKQEVTKVKISKQDITTKKELPGATLVVKDKNGKEVEKWVSTNEPHYIEGLEPGEYTLTETIAPSGYVLSTETIKFTLKNDGSVENVVMYNSKVVTKVKISKQDITTKEELPGATLVVKDKNGKEIEKWVSTNEPHYIEGLEPGEYTLTETIAPSGYVLSTETIKFTLKNDGSIASVVMYNKQDPGPTKVKISKQDITTKEELPGATLVIKDKNGKEVEKWVSTTEPHYIEGLEPGEYTLTETIAPSGYVLSTETIKFTLKEDGSIKNVVMYNEKETITTKVKISKQDITTKEELPGATLVVKDKKGNVLAEWVSTNVPYYIEGLEPGEYTLTETMAPNGYLLSSETITFIVKDDGSITDVVMYNSLYEVPITDLNISKTAMIIASLLIVIGMGTVVYYVKFSK